MRYLHDLVSTVSKVCRNQTQLLPLTISGRLGRYNHLRQGSWVVLRQRTALNLALLHVVGYVILVLVHVLGVVPTWTSNWFHWEKKEDNKGM